MSIYWRRQWGNSCSKDTFYGKAENGLDRDSWVSEEKGMEELGGLCAINHQDQMAFIHGF